MLKKDVFEGTNVGVQGSRVERWQGADGRGCCVRINVKGGWYQNRFCIGSKGQYGSSSGGSMRDGSGDDSDRVH